MSNALLIGGIGVVGLVAALLSQWAGLFVIALSVVVMMPIWGLSGGSMLIPVVFVLPPVIGFVIGRLAKRKLERA